MKPLPLLLALAASLPLVQAKQIQTTATLADLGVFRPERLTGSAAQRDFYLPLPSRIFDAGTSRIRVAVQPSPQLSPDSLVSLLVNDRPVDTVRVGKGGLLTLESAIPKGTRADDPSRNILKLTVKGNLALAPNAASSEPAMDREMTWIDVQPDSSFTFAFDDRAADWLSVGRLAITLRPTVSVVAPESASPAQIDLALKLASWVARNAPRSALAFGSAPPADATADRFVIEPANPDKTPLEISAHGAARVIHVRAGTPAETEGIWRSLQAAEKIPLPGNRWSDVLVQNFNAPKTSGAFLPDLDPGSLALIKGSGDTSATFRFDLAKLSRTSADLSLNLRGALSSAEARNAAVFLNDRLVFSAPLPADAKTFNLTVPLPAAELRATNAVTVTMFPATDSAASYFWQLAPDSSVRVVGSAAATPTQNLLEASARFASGANYQTWLASPADWPTATYAVAWLQRVNPIHLLSPVLVDKLSGNVPALVVGSLSAATPPGVTDFPVSVKDGRLLVRSTADSSQLSLAPAAGLGIWQLGALAGDVPALLVDSWGKDGAAALAAVSAQMADSVWIETGDVVIGDGASPVLTFATRAAPLPALAELPKAIAAEKPAPAADSAASAEPTSVKIASNLSARWLPYRWWIIGGLWLVLSAVILWIFEQGRRRASH